MNQRRREIGEDLALLRKLSYSRVLLNFNNRLQYNPKSRLQLCLKSFSSVQMVLNRYQEMMETSTKSQTTRMVDEFQIRRLTMMDILLG